VKSRRMILAPTAQRATARRGAVRGLRIALKIVALYAVMLLATALALAHRPRMVRWLPQAPVHASCPLGGMTRAFVALCRGDARQAKEHNGNGPVVFAAVAATAALGSVVFLRDIACGRRRVKLTRGYQE